MKKIKLKVGDVFAIELNMGEYGFGQIVAFPRHKYVFIICIFKRRNMGISELNLEEICNSEILFLGYTSDAKLYHNDWVIIGNYTSNISAIKLPYYKLGSPPDSYIVDYKGERLLKIDEEVFNALRFETEVGPSRFENALKSFYGLQDWKEDYNVILYENSLSSNKIAEKLLNR
ncbi:MAG: hypothetical protein H0X33_10190 [Taibaiella sp.]|nr:hypothetical protein [Taibaiella sp.]